jgi:hypothetical protein
MLAQCRFDREVQSLRERARRLREMAEENPTPLSDRLRAMAHELGARAWHTVSCRLHGFEPGLVFGHLDGKREAAPKPAIYRASLRGKAGPVQSSDEVVDA